MLYKGLSDLKYFHEIVSHSERYPIMMYYHAQQGIQYCAKHWHRSLELAIYISTPLTVWLNGVTKEYASDEFYLFNCGDVHELMPHNCENPQGVTLLFPYEFLMDYSISLDSVHFLETAGEFWDAELRKSLHKIVELSFRGKDDPYYYLLINSEIFHVLHILVTQYCKSNPDDYARSFQHIERCKEILAYINKNFNNKITLDSLAKELGLSNGYLARYFSKYLGTTFKKHLTSVRLENSLTDVIRNDKTMLDIAMVNGFSDYRSFIKSFREWYMITPYQYRINYNKKDSNEINNYNRPEQVYDRKMKYLMRDQKETNKSTKK